VMVAGVFVGFGLLMCERDGVDCSLTSKLFIPGTDRKCRIVNKKN